MGAGTPYGRLVWLAGASGWTQLDSVGGGRSRLWTCDLHADFRLMPGSQHSLFRSPTGNRPTGMDHRVNSGHSDCWLGIDLRLASPLRGDLAPFSAGSSRGSQARRRDSAGQHTRRQAIHWPLVATSACDVFQGVTARSKRVFLDCGVDYAGCKRI